MLPFGAVVIRGKSPAPSASGAVQLFPPSCEQTSEGVTNPELMLLQLVAMPAGVKFRQTE
jgi:hypothetical protein